MYYNQSINIFHGRLHYIFPFWASLPHRRHQDVEEESIGKEKLKGAWGAPSFRTNPRPHLQSEH